MFAKSKAPYCLAIAYYISDSLSCFTVYDRRDMPRRPTNMFIELTLKPNLVVNRSSSQSRFAHFEFLSVGYFNKRFSEKYVPAISWSSESRWRGKQVLIGRSEDKRIWLNYRRNGANLIRFFRTAIDHTSAKCDYQRTRCGTNTAENLQWIADPTGFYLQSISVAAC